MNASSYAFRGVTLENRQGTVFRCLLRSNNFFPFKNCSPLPPPPPSFRSPQKYGVLLPLNKAKTSDWAFLAFPGLGDGVKRPHHFLKTIEGMNMKLIPLINHREVNLLQLSYLSCDVTKASSLIFMAAILDFRTLSKCCKNLVFRFKCVE